MNYSIGFRFILYLMFFFGRKYGFIQFSVTLFLNNTNRIQLT